MAQYKMTTAQYIEKYKATAIRNMKDYGIPASITLAQGILESGNGGSRLAVDANNHFGIKCKSSWTGGRVYHDDDEKGECFRRYHSAAKSYEDHAKFLTSSPRYASLFDLRRTDYRGWAKGLKAAGYATNPQYAQRLISMIEKYELYQYDNQIGLGKLDKYLADRNDRQLEKIAKSGVEFGEVNGVVYLIARQSDGYSTLSKLVGIGKSEMLSYNDLDRNSTSPLEGERIFISRKKSKAAKEHIYHKATKGQTAQEISQIYGVRAKSLIRKNQYFKSLRFAYEGQVVRLR